MTASLDHGSTPGARGEAMLVRASFGMLILFALMALAAILLGLNGNVALLALMTVGVLTIVTFIFTAMTLIIGEIRRAEAARRGPTPSRS